MNIKIPMDYYIIVMRSYIQSLLFHFYRVLKFALSFNLNLLPFWFVNFIITPCFICFLSLLS